MSTAHVAIVRDDDGTVYPLRVLRLATVREMTGLARSSLYASIGRGEFPHPIRITRGAVGWVEGEVRDWIVARIAERDETP